MPAIISQLYTYPLKSCAGISVNELVFDEKGPLLDRRWMLVERISGVFLSQRTVPNMALIKTSLVNGNVWAHQAMNNNLSSSLRLPTNTIEPSDGGVVLEKPMLPLVDVAVWDDKVKAYDCGDEASAWFSELLSVDCRLVYQGDSQRFASEEYADKYTQVSFADGFPLLIVAQSSIDLLNDDCSVNIDATNFRPNVVVENTRPFAEKLWATLTTKQLELKVVKPCERCVIPTLNPNTASKEPSILTVLKSHCVDNGRIIFGQNLTFKPLSKNYNKTMVGDKNSLHIQFKLTTGDALVIK